MNSREPASRIKENTAGSSEEALFAGELADLPHIVPSTAVNRGNSLANAAFDEDYSEIPPQIEMNWDDKRKGAAPVTETNKGGTPAGIFLARVSSASTRPKPNRGTDRGDPESRREKNRAGSSEEASFAQYFADLTLTEPSINMSSGEFRAAALVDGDLEERFRDEMNRGRKRAAIACVVRDASGRMIDGFSKEIAATSPQQAEALALIETLMFLLPRSREFAA